MNGQKLKRRLAAGLAGLARHGSALDRMNVFPVPDGDTGVNMRHTLQRAYAEIEADDSDDAAWIAGRFAYGALMGARGNSGTILSQLLQGFAIGLNQAPTLRPADALAGCQMAVKLAYQSVSEPVEGTILTVAREAAEALQNRAANEMTLHDMLAVLTAAAEESLHNTPNLLPVLKEAGVVDSGGLGLFLFLQGMTNSAADDRALEGFLPRAAKQAKTTAAAAHYGYDVQFLMLGQAMDVGAIRRDFEKLGESVVVVGDAAAIKVHLHVQNPAIPFDYAIQTGAQLDDVVVENMQRQHQEYTRGRQAAGKIAVIAVAAGDGLRAIFQDLNCARVIAAGQDMDVDAESFLEVIHSLPTERVIILPNSRELMMTAQQAARQGLGRDVRVAPTKTAAQGISAMMAYDKSRTDMETMYGQMVEASGLVRSIEITRVAHSAEFQGMRLGIVDGEIWAAADTIEKTLLDVFGRFSIDDWELATVYYGEGAAESAANQLIGRLSNAIKGLQFELVYGGQPYPYLIGLE